MWAAAAVHQAFKQQGWLEAALEVGGGRGCQLLAAAMLRSTVVAQLLQALPQAEEQGSTIGGYVEHLHARA
jgi:hypothetical protein